MAETPSNDILSHLIDTGRITLHIRERGHGPLMVFLHGITANSAVFEPLMVRFSNRFRTIAVDQRGHGLSDKPEAGYTADHYADDVAALIRILESGPAVLVGHSLGARNAVTVAANDPDLVRSVIAIDFTPYIEASVFDTLEARVNAGDQFFKDVGAVTAYLQARYPKIPAAAIAVRAMTGYKAVERGLRPLASPAAMAETAKELRSDLTQVYRSVRRPVLIVRGESSALVSIAALAKTRQLRPDLPVVVVPDADHYVNEEAPELIFQAISNFIDA